MNGRIKGFHFTIGSSEQFLSQERMCPVCPLGEENWTPPPKQCEILREEWRIIWDQTVAPQKVEEVKVSVRLPSWRADVEAASGEGSSKPRGPERRVAPEALGEDTS